MAVILSRRCEYQRDALIPFFHKRDVQPESPVPNPTGQQFQPIPNKKSKSINRRSSTNQGRFFHISSNRDFWFTVLLLNLKSVM